MSRDSDAEQSGCLWVVATPIGSLGDMSPRACEVLAAAELILAEDTRRTRKLLSHFSIPSGGKLKSLHRHNERGATARALKLLERGGSVALVSDAGTPVLSDPGHDLVRHAHERGVRVLSVPGPSSFTASLAASPQIPLPATLVGFLPARAGERARRLEEFASLGWTLVILLSPHRLAAEIKAVAEVLGEGRSATLMAELSKVHERACTATLGELARSGEAENPKGEYVLVVGPQQLSETAEPSLDEVEASYRSFVGQGMNRRSAIRAAARAFGMSQKKIYAMLLKHKNRT